MFHVLMSLAIAALFFVLTPGVVVSLPSGKGKFVVAATHAVIFALVFHFTHKAIWNFTQRFEGFNEDCIKSGSKLTSAVKNCCDGKTAAKSKDGLGQVCP